MGYFVCGFKLWNNTTPASVNDIPIGRLVYEERFRLLVCDYLSLGGDMLKKKPLESATVCDTSTYKTKEVTPKELSAMFRRGLLIGVHKNFVYCMSVYAYRLSEVLDLKENTLLESSIDKDITKQAELDNALLIDPYKAYNKYWFCYSIYSHMLKDLLCKTGYMFVCDYILYLIRTLSHDLLDQIMQYKEGELRIWGIEICVERLFYDGYISLDVKDIDNFKILITKYKLMGGN